MKTCIKCYRVRAKKYLEQAVFKGRSWQFDEKVDVWRCISTKSCAEYRRSERKHSELAGRPELDRC